MKKLLASCCIATAVLAAVSCEKPENGYTGTNYIYLTAAANSMYDTADDALDVTVQLTTALDADLALTLKVENDEAGIITLEGNPLTIKAGEKTGTVTIKTKELESGLSKNFRITLDNEATVLPEKVAWKEDFTFTVHTSAVPELTAEQTAIIEAYRQKTGIDLTDYLGLVDVTTVYTASNPDSDIPNEPITITGKTTILLSEQSTADSPVLKMAVNPMGLTDELYKKLRESTVTNEYWLDENSSPSYGQLMEAIKWNANSEETFSVTLDGITLNGDGTIDFVDDVECLDGYGDEVIQKKVNFEFNFTAYDREKDALAEEKIGTAVDEDWYPDATANPEHWLNSDDISEDAYEYGNFIEYSAGISEKAMTFTFPIYNTIDYDYSKAIVTYTPNK